MGPEVVRYIGRRTRAVQAVEEQDVSREKKRRDDWISRGHTHAQGGAWLGSKTNASTLRGSNSSFYRTR